MANNTNIKYTTPLFMKPVEIRQLTDKFSILFLLLSLSLWLGIGIYGILNSGHDSRCIWSDLLSFFPAFLIYGVITVLVIILLLVVFNMLKDDWLVSIAKFPTTIMGLITFIYIMAKVLIFPKLDWTMMILPIFVIVLIYNITIMICIKGLVTSLGPMIKEQIRSIVQSLTLLLLSFGIIFLLMIVFCTSFIILSRLMNCPMTHTEDFMLLVTKWFWFLQHWRGFTFVLASIYIFSFIWNLGFMVMGDYFAHYYDKQNVSKIYVSSSIARVLRYHVGTVAFLSTPILPSLCALVMLVKNNKQPANPSDNKLTVFISNIILIIDIPEYALIQTSISGSKSLKSIKQMIDVHHSNPLLFLTLNAVTIKIMDFIKVLAMIIGYGATALFVFTTHNIFGSTFPLFMICLAVIFVNLIQTLLWRSAACTFAIYKLIRDQHESKISSDQSELTIN